MRFVQLLTLILLLSSSSLVFGEQQPLRKDVTTRLGRLENRIERGRMTGELTTSEAARLRTKMESLRYQQSKLERDGATPQREKELDTRLYLLERETERMMNNLERR